MWTRRLATRMALAAIRCYQRFISPYKGFDCAYRVHTGRCSCSALGYRAIRAHGVLLGLGILLRRTHLCGVAHRRRSPAPFLRRVSQRGVCDLSCDFPDLSNKCDLGCCDCLGCDWPRRGSAARRRTEQSTYIPTKRRSGRQ